MPVHIRTVVKLSMILILICGPIGTPCLPLQPMSWLAEHGARDGSAVAEALDGSRQMGPKHLGASEWCAVINLFNATWECTNHNGDIGGIHDYQISIYMHLF